MTRTTVLVASPSSLNRARLAKVISSLSDFEVIATAADLSESFNFVENHEPGLVVIADEFYRMDEFVAMQSMFYALGTRWIVLESGTDGPQSAKASGPNASDPRLTLNMAPEETLAQIRKVQALRRQSQIPKSQPVQSKANSFDKVVVIGSSTGGVDALLTLLSTFPADCPPTAIVQHTGRGFSTSLVQLLERRCKPTVVAATDGLALRQGMVCVAGGTDGHLTLVKSDVLRCQIRPGPPISGHVPSVDALFRSAMPLAPKLVGVLLTGMGQDGASGLLGLRRAGVYTIGQDEASSVVYGMPKAAFEMGAVQMQLPIDRIGNEILKVCIAGPARSPLQDNRATAR
jgi:two-component system, chemotaxis family, protein-glutamate methylesterase/glutaminase